MAEGPRVWCPRGSRGRRADLVFLWKLPSRGAGSRAKTPRAFVSGAAGIALDASPPSSHRLAGEGSNFFSEDVWAGIEDGPAWAMPAWSRCLDVLKGFADKLVSINPVVVVLRKEKRVDNAEIQKFISKKADLLFALSWKSDAPATSEVHEDGEGGPSLKISFDCGYYFFLTVLHSDKTEHKN